MDNSRPEWSSRTKSTISVVLAALGVYLLYRFNIVLAPLVMALILAYILTPIANICEARLHMPRALATLLAYLILLGILGAILMVVIPPLASQLSGMSLDLQRFLEEARSFFRGSISIAGLRLDLEAGFQGLIQGLQGLLEPVVGQTLGFLIRAIGSIVWVIFTLVVSFYLIKDTGSLGAWLESLVPPAFKPDYLRLTDLIREIWRSFFRGQIVLALVVASIITGFGLIMGLPFALAMGVLAGLLEFLPSVGHAIWLFIASILAFFGGSTYLPLPNWAFMLLLIGLHMVFQQFDLNYLIPRIIGRRVHLPPVVVILGIVTGAVIAGVLGILLAAPTIASARVIGRYIYGNLFDLNPFPENTAPAIAAPDPRWWRKPRKGQSIDREE
jgi:predicted PurR-regulated permease PerM